MTCAGATDGFLHELGRGAAHRHWRSLPLVVLAAGALYGAVMGGFMITPQRLRLIAYAAIKVPLLILTTTLICLPGFFIFNTVAGVRADFRRAMLAILSGQASLTVALASLAPITAFAYISGVSHRGALLFNALMFSLATAAAQVVMIRRYRPLLADSHRGRAHRAMLATWLILYIFVGVQMGWVLRPFVGHPDMAVAFFRQDSFTNAYVEIARLLSGRAD